jgi:SHS2 domain-containing protein
MISHREQGDTNFRKGGSNGANQANGRGRDPVTEPTGLPYQVLSHTADTGISATADSLASLIAALSQGMFELMVRCPTSGDPGDLTIDVDASSIQDLVVDTLSELLYRFERDDLAFHSFRVEADPDTLHATVWATGVELSEIEPVGPPIKAVTYHDLLVEHGDGEWRGRVYFDV